MYEFTHKGLWFRWTLLDPASKLLGAASLAASMLAAIPLALVGGDISYRLGYIIASGGAVPHQVVRDFTPMMAAWVIGFGLASAALWWLFSLRQDEMFNRVQNWALGMGAAWTLAGTAIWALLELAGLVPAVSPIAIVGCFVAAMTAFWMIAVRRWA